MLVTADQLAVSFEDTTSPLRSAMMGGHVSYRRGENVNAVLEVTGGGVIPFGGKFGNYVVRFADTAVNSMVFSHDKFNLSVEPGMVFENGRHAITVQSYDGDGRGEFPVVISGIGEDRDDCVFGFTFNRDWLDNHLTSEDYNLSGYYPRPS